MVRFTAAAAVGSAMAGIANAAGAGSKEDYASGRVHERIMGIKMVRTPNYLTVDLLD